MSWSLDVGATLTIDMTILRASMNEMPFHDLALTLTFIQPASKWIQGWVQGQHVRGQGQGQDFLSSSCPRGCIGPHSNAILICFELPPLLPPKWFPSLSNPHWLCFSSLYADDLDLSKTPEPLSAAHVEVCAGDSFVSHVQANGVFFHWVCHPYCVVQFWLWSLRLLLCPSRKCPKRSFAICYEQRSVFSLVLLLKAIHAASTCWSFFKWPLGLLCCTLGVNLSSYSSWVDLNNDSCQQYGPPDHNWN